MDLAWTFPWLLFLHVLGAIVAFGPTFAFSFIGAIGWRGAAARELRDAGVAHDHRRSSSTRSASPCRSPAWAMIAVRQINPFERPNWWLALAIVLYLIALRLFVLRAAQHVERVIEISSAPPPPGRRGPPPELLALVGADPARRDDPGHRCSSRSCS